MGKVKTPFNYNVLTIMMMIIIIIIIILFLLFKTNLTLRQNTKNKARQFITIFVIKIINSNDSSN
jgi:competence protein ComGC